LREARRKAMEILEDKSYLVDLMNERKSLEDKTESEARRIIDEAHKKARDLKESMKSRIDSIAKQIASMVAGVEV
jgi:F0F1-type ATP synthase membrane subunit b/b'